MLNRLLCLATVAALPLCALDVGNFGAVGNGVADDTAAIQRAMDTCSVNDTLYFGPGNYLVRGVFPKGNCNYVGTGSTTLTLLTRNRFIFDISERSWIRITGIRFNANERGGAVIAQGAAPVSHIHIDNCEFRNVVSSSVYPANLTVVSTWGIIDSRIENNRFFNISGGIWLTTVQNVEILNNSFVDITQSNAVYVAPNAVSFQSGDNLRIAGNTGTNITGIAIELFRPDHGNGSRLVAPVIENNTFSNWTSPGPFGLSITHGDGAIVRNNRLNNATGVMQDIGIELIAANAQLEGNIITGGFYNGISVQGAAAPIIRGNTITGMADIGILLACDNGHGRCASRGSLIANNLVTNAHHVGIKLDNDWSNSTITRNTIIRTAGYWPDDSRVFFSGIHQSPAPGPGIIDANWIIQDSPNWPAGFWFAGIRINSQMSGSQVTNNVVGSSAVSPFGSGLIDNTGDATRGWVIGGNAFLNVLNQVN